MATVQPWAPIMIERIWTQEEKDEWLAAHRDAPTHVVTFEPLYQIEVCIPPWEHARAPDRSVGRRLGQAHERGARRGGFGAARVVAAHHEGNSLEIYATVTPRPRLHRVSSPHFG